MMIDIIRIIALVLCFFCLTGCFRGVSEETAAISKDETTAKITEDASSSDTEGETTEAVSTAENESATLAETVSEITVTEPEALPEVTESEPEPLPEVTEAGPEALPEATEAEPETLPPVDNGNAPAPVEGQITYIDGILVVNKTYPLPADYNPGVDPVAQDALWTMISAASADGLSIWARSGFRSYSDQLWQYNVYVERDGAAVADTYSARPGHSEHQSGLAFDMNSLDRAFANTAEGQWLAANSYKYGFIIRYPAGKEHITGYMYEPWHVRYVGVELATEIHALGVCLEEYLGITSEYASATTLEPVI